MSPTEVPLEVAMESLMYTKTTPDRVEKQVPLEHQLALLGLNGAYVNGLRTLDIGCGNGALVKRFLSSGADAYGIDPRAPQEPRFTQRMIYGIQPGQGIDAPSNHYDLITSFQTPPLSHAFSLEFPDQGVKEHLYPGDLERHREQQAIGAYIISEIGRTLKRGGKAILFPYQRLLVERAGHLLRMDNVKHTVEPIAPELMARYLEWEGIGKATIEFLTQGKDHENYRHVLTKK